MLYYIHTLQPEFFLNRIFISTETQKKLIELYHLPTDSILSLNIWKNAEESKAILTLKLHNRALANITINEVNYNCGAIHLSNLNSLYTENKLGTQLLKAVEEWCAYAGYTIIFGNTAAGQNNLVPYFKKLEYQEMMPHYVNARSGNWNIWLYKNLKPEAKQGQENYDNDFEPDDDNYDEEEQF